MHDLSVVVANYNHGRYLKTSIEAIANQSFKPKEIVIVDDGSTDDSVEVILDLASRYKNIKLLRNQENQGAVYSVNKALAEASGQYIYWAAADDLVLPGFFEKSMSALRMFSKAGLSCSIAAYFKHPDDIMVAPGYRPSSIEYLSPQDIVRVRRHNYTFDALNINGHTAVIKRSSLIDIGGFHESLAWHCDWFALWVIAGRHGICYIPEPLAAIRISDTSYSTSSRSWKRQRPVIEEILNRIDSTFFRDARLLGGLPGVLGIPGVLLFSLLRPKYWRHLSFSLFVEAIRGVAISIRARLRR